jgi:hypothetical protein
MSAERNDVKIQVHRAFTTIILEKIVELALAGIATGLTILWATFYFAPDAHATKPIPTTNGNASFPPTGGSPVALVSYRLPAATTSHAFINACDEPDTNTPDKDSKLIRKRDGKYFFDFEDAKIYEQATDGSFEFKFLADCPATIQPKDNVNYRIVFLKKSKERILVNACKSLKDASFISFVQIFDCDGVTNNVLRELGRNPNLIEIGLDGCNKFDDAGLAYLSKSEHLRMLGLYAANGVKADGIRKVLNDCKSLDAIGIDRIRSLKPDFVQQLHTEYHGQIKIWHSSIKCDCLK